VAKTVEARWRTADTPRTIQKMKKTCVKPNVERQVEAEVRLLRAREGGSGDKRV
jgi:hypothetical protein